MIRINNTYYNGEVLEKLLTVATTNNELVEKGLIHVIPGVSDKIAIPRLRTGKMLQKRKENPTVEDSKGNFDYSEQSLAPVDFMALTVFNPRAFEHIWRPFQPKGDLVFRELPPSVQNELLDALSKQVQFELGHHYINGVYGDSDDELFNGILTQAAKDDDVIIASCNSTKMVDRLKALRLAIPVSIIENPCLRILMSPADFNKYDDELTGRESKNRDETTRNPKLYKDIKIETLAAWPDDLLVATLCSPDPMTSNLFAAVNLKDDEKVIKIGPVSEMSELYFFKMLMMADTNIAFGEEFIALDCRDNPAFVASEEPAAEEPVEETPTIQGASELSVLATSGSNQRTYATSNGAGITAESNAEWLGVSVNGNVVTFTRQAYAYDAEGEATRSATVTIGIAGTNVTKTVTVTQPMAEQA